MPFINPNANTIFSQLAGLVGLLTATSAVDVVAVYNQQTLRQVFQYGRPLRAGIRKTSKVMQYPIENGSVISDHKIINPIEINMPLVIPAGFYESTYTEIEQLFKNSTLLSVQTKVGVGRNFIISDMPHTEEPDMYDCINLSLQLTEVFIIVSPTIYAPADPAQSNTVARGQVAPKEVPPEKFGTRTVTNRNGAIPQPYTTTAPASNPNGGIRGAVISMMKPKNMEAGAK